jgi:hypothetical protein
VVAAATGPPFLQYPLFVVSEFVLILSLGEIQGCKVCACCFMKVQFVWFFPVIPASKQLSISLSFVVNQIRS